MADSRFKIDCTRLRSLGWTPTVLPLDGLRECVDWYHQNPHHWDHAPLEAALAPHPLLDGRGGYPVRRYRGVGGGTL